MTKQEVRKLAAQFGVEAEYSGKTYDDREKGFFFKPTLLELLNRRLTKLNSLLLNVHNEDLQRSIKEQIESTQNNIEDAKNKLEQFMQTDTYKTGLKDETPTV